MLLGEAPESSEGAASAAALAEALRAVQPAVRTLRSIGVTGEPRVLEMPEPVQSP
jgi:hypothetical protein